LRYRMRQTYLVVREVYLRSPVEAVASTSPPLFFASLIVHFSNTSIQQVYLVLGHANSLGEICRVPRKAPKLMSIPIFHENIVGMTL